MPKAKYYNGKTISEWARECGLKRETIANRIKEGWTIEDAISVPYNTRRNTEISIAKLAIENNISPKTIKKRINNGMSIEEALMYSYKKSYIGQRSGRLTVEKELEPKRDPNGKPRRQLLCLCDCGNYTTALAESISSGSKQSCGCLRKETISKMREKNLVGQRFNRLLVESEAFRDGRGIHWNCVCDCGNRCVVIGSNLLNGNSTSCGCYNKEIISERERKDITNQRFYKLVAKECVGKNEYNNYLWRCVCDCGREIVTTAARLLGGQIISCGCTKSKGEYFIENYFTNNGIKHRKGVYFNDLKLKTYLYFDFSIEDENKRIYLIEYQGEQHYKDMGKFGKQQREVTDKMKKEYCKKKNIPLFEIRYDEDIKEKLEEIIAQVNPVLSEQITA